MQLTLIRHGRTEWNRIGMLQGWRDSPLTVDAKRQLQRLPAALLACDVVYCSDLGRAMASARILANRNRRPIVVDCRLRERGFGELEGVQTGSMSGNIDRASGVESPDSLNARTREWLNAVRHRYPNGRVLAIVHGEWARALTVQLAGDVGSTLGNRLLDNGQAVQLKWSEMRQEWLDIRQDDAK